MIDKAAVWATEVLDPVAKEFKEAIDAATEVWVWVWVNCGRSAPYPGPTTTLPSLR